MALLERSHLPMATGIAHCLLYQAGNPIISKVNNKATNVTRTMAPEGMDLSHATRPPHFVAYIYSLNPRHLTNSRLSVQAHLT